MTEKPPYTVFQRKGTANWWIRFSIKGEGQIQKSLEIADRRDADRRALEVWSEARYRAKLGLTSQTKTFKKVAEEYIERLELEVERGERRAHQLTQFRGIIRRYFIGFFEDLPIDALSEAKISRFWDWRKSYWISGPGKDITHVTYMRKGRQIRRPVGHRREVPSLSEQRSEAVLLRQLMRQASRWGYIRKAELPDIEAPSVPANARPSFEAHEFSKLEAKSEERIADEVSMRNKTIRRHRTMLHCYIQVAAYSGCRPTELKNLNWGDLIGWNELRSKPIGAHIDTEALFFLRVRGKGKTRKFPPMPNAVLWFHNLWDLFVDATGREPTDGDPVFTTPSGKRLLSVKRSLGELLKVCDLQTDHSGAHRTSYSFRHFYISQMLVAGIDVFMLAKLCGTSSNMIDKFYGHVRLEVMPRELRPEWRQRLPHVELATAETDDDPAAPTRPSERDRDEASEYGGEADDD